MIILDLTNCSSLPEFLKGLPRIVPCEKGKHYKDYDVLEKYLPIEFLKDFKDLRFNDLPIGFNLDDLSKGAVVRKPRNGEKDRLSVCQLDLDLKGAK